jgi:hypothetical protein
MCGGKEHSDPLDGGGSADVGADDPANHLIDSQAGDDASLADGAADAGPLDPTPCLVGGNIAYFNGGNGPVTVTMGTDMRAPPVQDWEIDLQIFPAGQDAAAYPDYDLEFSSVRPNTPPLTVGDYPLAQATPYPGHPGMSIIGYSVPCNSTYNSEEFDISDLAMDGAGGNYGLRTFTVSFYETCNNTVTVHGCLHYAR